MQLRYQMLEKYPANKFEVTESSLQPHVLFH
jgi:hypothetical protein